MRFTPRLSRSRRIDAATKRALAEHQQSHVSRRVARALGICQTLLVARIMTLLLFIGLLPVTLPVVAVRLDSAHHAVLPLSGMNRDIILLIVAVAAALELYMVHRLGDRRPWARMGVLALEPVVITACTVALTYGATLAMLPLALSVAALCLLLLNQVRWAFRLEAQHQRLTGRRRGGVFLGYAPLSPDAPKPNQAVGYALEHPPRD